jgi:hypothetical protein
MIADAGRATKQQSAIANRKAPVLRRRGLVTRCWFTLTRYTLPSKITSMVVIEVVVVVVVMSA